MLGDERRERGQSSDQREEGLAEGVQGLLRVLQFETSCALEPLAVEADVPVGQVIDDTEEAGHDGVEAVSCHLLVNEAQHALAVGKDPMVHDIVHTASIWQSAGSEVVPRVFPEKDSLLMEETATVPHREHNFRDNFFHA